jgi:hypothetical protein
MANIMYYLNFVCKEIKKGFLAHKIRDFIVFKNHQLANFECKENFTVFLYKNC